MDINKKRNSPISMRVGDDEDPSACVTMVVLKDSMYLVKEASIWKVMLADGIDPDRRNSSLPNTQQRYSSLGASSEVVKRTLLQAKDLIKANLLPDHVDADAALSHSLSIVVELERIGPISDSLRSDFDRARDVVRKGPDDGTLSVPSFKRLEDEWSGVVDASDRPRACIRGLAFSFYGDLRKNDKWFKDLRPRLTFGAFECAYHNEVLNVVDHDLEFVRWLRNAKEHPKTDQSAILHNYRLLPYGNVAPPSLALIGRTKQSTDIDLAELSMQIMNCLIFAFEMCLLWICGSNVEPIFGKQVQILRRAKGEDGEFKPPFCYCVEFEGQIAVVG